MFGLRGEKTFGFGHIWWERIPSQGGGCIACAVCVAACSWSASEGTICIEWRRLDLTWDKNMAGQVASQSDHGHRDELIGCLVSACDKLFATHDLNCFLQVYSVQHSNPCLSLFGRAFPSGIFAQIVWIISTGHPYMDVSLLWFTITIMSWLCEWSRCWNVLNLLLNSASHSVGKLGANALHNGLSNNPCQQIILDWWLKLGPSPNTLIPALRVLTQTQTHTLVKTCSTPPCVTGSWCGC